MVSDSQRLQLDTYELNNYKVIVSNDYDSLINQINDYMSVTRVLCRSCGRGYKSMDTLDIHNKCFHKNSLAAYYSSKEDVDK